jgi:hypothetical protein
VRVLDRRQAPDSAARSPTATYALRVLTRFRALAATLVVLAAGTGAAAGASPAPGQPVNDPPITYADLPVGAPTTLPWWQAGRLHVGDAVIRTRRSEIVSSGGTTLVAGDMLSTRPDARWYVVNRARLRALPARTPLVSANGRWIAWREVRAPETDAYRRVERYRVVVYDAVRRRVVNHFRDRRLVAWEDGINGIWLRTLSNQGRLVLHRGNDGVQVLSARGRPLRFGGPHVRNGATPDGWPRGTTVLRFGSDRSIFGHVRSDGGFDRVGGFTVSFSGTWSADGAHYVYGDYDSYDAESETFRSRPLHGPTVRLGTPVDAPYLRVVGWESSDAVVLWSHDQYGDERSSHLVRCFVDDGRCEQVPGGPDARSYATM